MLDKLKNLMTLEDETQELELEPIDNEEELVPNKVISQEILQNTLLIFSPSFDMQETNEIIDNIKKNFVIIKFDNLTVDEKSQLLDIISGAIYAIDGEIISIGANAIICAPNNKIILEK